MKSLKSKARPCFQFICFVSILTPHAFSQDCERVWSILLDKVPSESKIKDFEILQNGNGILSVEDSLVGPETTRKPEFNLLHHPDYLQARLPKEPQLKMISRTFDRKGGNGSSPALNDRGYMAVGGKNLSVFLLDSKTKQLEPIKNSFDDFGEVMRDPSWGQNSILAVVNREGQLFALRVEPTTKKLELLNRFETHGRVTTEPSWGPHGTIAVVVKVENKAELHFLKFNEKTYHFDPLDKVELSDSYFAKPVWRSDGALAIAGEDGHLMVMRINPDSQKLDLVDKIKTHHQWPAEPAWGPDDTLAFTGTGGLLNVAKLDPKTQKMEVLDQFKIDKSKFGSLSWGPDKTLALVGRDENLYVLRLNQSNKLELVHKQKMQSWVLTSPSWGPENTLAVADGDRLKIFKYHTNTNSLDIVDTIRMLSPMVGGSVSWGREGTLFVSTFSEVYQFKLEEKESWFYGLFKSNKSNK